LPKTATLYPETGDFVSWTRQICCQKRRLCYFCPASVCVCVCVAFDRSSAES